MCKINNHLRFFFDKVIVWIVGSSIVERADIAPEERQGVLIPDIATLMFGVRYIEE